MAELASEHKVRGGSALSLALINASAAADAGHDLGKSSPSDSAASTLTASHHQLSAAPSGAEWPSPAASPSAAAAASSCGPAALLSARLPHSAATAPQAAAAAAQCEQRRRLPFLACFGSAGGMRVLGEEGPARLQPAVSASEVGIRPCFYWLEGPDVSEADRLCAEASARWLKSDCQVGDRARQQTRSRGCTWAHALLRLVARLPGSGPHCRRDCAVQPAPAAAAPPAAALLPKAACALQPAGTPSPACGRWHAQPPPARRGAARSPPPRLPLVPLRMTPL